jgi:hypothetical protein
MSKSEYIGARKIIPWYIKSTSRRSYLLSEKAICGLCGAPLWHNIIRNKYKGRIKEYQYYACRNKVQKPVDAEPCKLPSIPQDWLEHEVWEQMQSFFGNQEKFERVILQANCQLAEDRKQLDDIADRIVTVEKEIEDIETKQQNITGAIAKGIITDDEARKAMANLRNLKTNLQDEESELELKQSILCKRGPQIEKLKKTRLWWFEYAFQLSNEEKRKIIDMLVDQIIVSPGSKPLPDNCWSFINGKDIKTPAIWVEIIGRIPLIDFYGLHKDSKYQPDPTYKNCSNLRYVLTTA